MAQVVFHTLKLKWENDADTLNFQCENSQDDRIADFDLKLMQIESEHMEIPEQQYIRPSSCVAWSLIK